MSEPTNDQAMEGVKILNITQDRFGQVDVAPGTTSMTALEAIGILTIAIAQLTMLSIQNAAILTQQAAQASQSGLYLPAQPGKIIT